MNSKIYYAGANGYKGYVTYFGERAKDLTRNIVLKSFPQKISTEIFNDIIKLSAKYGCRYETIISANSSDKIGGIIFPDASLSVAVNECFGGSLPANAEVYDFTAGCAGEVSGKVTDILSNEKAEREKMFKHMETAKHIHDEWEKIYISATDFGKLDSAVEELISVIFEDVTPKDATAVNTNGFFGTMLTDGNKNYIDELTDSLKSRIFIKGRPGTGKSTLLKKIRAAALSRGFDTETYYCSFDTDSLDMVVIRGLSLCIFDSTAPHEMFPAQDSDSIFDVYDIAVKPNTDEDYSAELSDIQTRYDAEMSGAKKHLAEALKYRAEADAVLEGCSGSAGMSTKILEAAADILSK